MVRSIYRNPEYGQGNNGALMQKEVYVYLLDATLMFGVAGIFAMRYPGGLLKEPAKLPYYIDATTSSDSYPMVESCLAIV